MKVLLAYDNETIPANLHYNFEERNPNAKILDDREHGVRVVDENCAFPGEKGERVAAVSSFGFGGTNAHILVKDVNTEVTK